MERSGPATVPSSVLGSSIGRNLKVRERGGEGRVRGEGEGRGKIRWVVQENKAIF